MRSILIGAGLAALPTSAIAEEFTLSSRNCVDRELAGVTWLIELENAPDSCSIGSRSFTENTSFARYCYVAKFERLSEQNDSEGIEFTLDCAYKADQSEWRLDCAGAGVRFQSPVMITLTHDSRFSASLGTVPTESNPEGKALRLWGRCS